MNDSFSEAGWQHPSLGRIDGKRIAKGPRMAESPTSRFRQPEISPADQRERHVGLDVVGAGDGDLFRICAPGGLCPRFPHAAHFLATSVIPVGMLVGVGVILASIVLTGIYVYRANSTFDPLIDEIVRESIK